MCKIRARNVEIAKNFKPNLNLGKKECTRTGSVHGQGGVLNCKRGLGWEPKWGAGRSPANFFEKIQFFINLTMNK